MIVLLQGVVPLALIGWVLLGRERPLLLRVLKVAGTASYLAALAMAGLWLTLPWYTPIALALVLVAAVSINLAWRPATGWWPYGIWSVAAAVVYASAAVATTVLALYAAGGRRMPEGTAVVDLSFPLRNGDYIAVAGGNRALINPHLMTLSAERFRDYRGQSYGIDIVKVGALGDRAAGVAPADPAAYRIFGQPVYAPCSGTVVWSEDGHPDMSVPRVDLQHLAGNHVLLECGGAHVLLGHLKRNTVGVHPGDAVRVGVPLGAVGNSGNSDEPHLHLHAQRPASGPQRLSGEPLIIRVDGRYLVRNDIVHAQGDVHP